MPVVLHPITNPQSLSPGDLLVRNKFYSILPNTWTAEVATVTEYYIGVRFRENKSKTTEVFSYSHKRFCETFVKYVEEPTTPATDLLTKDERVFVEKMRRIYKGLFMSIIDRLAPPIKEVKFKAWYNIYPITSINSLKNNHRVIAKLSSSGWFTNKPVRIKNIDHYKREITVSFPEADYPFSFTSFLQIFNRAKKLRSPV